MHPQQLHGSSKCMGGCVAHGVSPADCALGPGMHANPQILLQPHHEQGGAHLRAVLALRLVSRHLWHLP